MSSVDIRLRLLRSSKIVGAKRVLMADNFSGQNLCDERHKRDLASIRRKIEKGEPIDDFYRYGIGVTPDELLRIHGVMHLHLGGKSSNVILYLLQYPEHVVFLSINTHVHLDDVPPGKKLPNGFERKAAQQVADAIARAEEDARSAAAALTEKQAQQRQAADRLRAAFRARKAP